MWFFKSVDHSGPDPIGAANTPETLHSSNASMRHSINLAFNNKNMKKDGIKCLSQSDQNSATELFDFMDKYGVFIVRNGELES
ncbi:hypothetical protein [Legionella sp. PC1000]|uniref:hypothetical protein n=1 Tax=Legionella sp. PC1000 TaxID=2746060 RepID=UPI0015FBF7C0|nr:hypothetical protein [Legionella sp. PC1000]